MAEDKKLTWPLPEGTVVNTNFNGGAIGEIVGIASELGPAGFIYIVKLIHRGGQPWIDYKYSCVVIPQGMLTIA